jgi:hypothetical protein
MGNSFLLSATKFVYNWNTRQPLLHILGHHTLTADFSAVSARGQPRLLQPAHQRQGHFQVRRALLRGDQEDPPGLGSSGAVQLPSSTGTCTEDNTPVPVNIRHSRRLWRR